MKDDIVHIHLGHQKALNVLSMQVAQRIERIASLGKTLAAIAKERHSDNVMLAPVRTKLRTLRTRLASVAKQQAEHSVEDKKLQVLLKRTEKDVLRSLGRLQDIGYFKEGQARTMQRVIKTTSLAPQIRDNAQLGLNQMHMSIAQSKFELAQGLSERRKQMQVLQTLDQGVEQLRLERERAEDVRGRQQKLRGRRSEQLATVAVAEFRRDIGLPAKIDRALALVNRHGHVSRPTVGCRNVHGTTAGQCTEPQPCAPAPMSADPVPSPALCCSSVCLSVCLSACLSVCLSVR
jgi:hypothetical protein